MTVALSLRTPGSHTPVLARRAGQPVVSSGTDATFRAVLTIPVDAPAGPEVVWVAGVPAPGAAFSVPVGSVETWRRPRHRRWPGRRASRHRPRRAAPARWPPRRPPVPPRRRRPRRQRPRPRQRQRPVPASGSQPANPPVGVVATAVAGGVELRWRAPAGPRATEYYLYRGTAPGQEVGSGGRHVADALPQRRRAAGDHLLLRGPGHGERRDLGPVDRGEQHGARGTDRVVGTGHGSPARRARRPGANCRGPFGDARPRRTARPSRPAPVRVASRSTGWPLRERPSPSTTSTGRRPRGPSRVPRWGPRRPPTSTGPCCRGFLVPLHRPGHDGCRVGRPSAQAVS